MDIKKRIISAAISAIFATSLCAAENKIAADFANPPADSHAETWWHFTTNHITKEGITRDLEAMKKIGYTGAHIFIPNCYGKIPEVADVQIMTPLWKEAMRHAAKEAKRLGLSLGVHNCPGWSSSGGPWIKPEDSMKCLVYTQNRLGANSAKKTKLAPPPDYKGYYRDIAVLAIPAAEPLPTPTIDSFPKLANDSDLCAEGKTPVKLPIEKTGGKASITYEFAAPTSARTAELIFDGQKIHFTLDVSASDDGKNFKKIGHLDYHNAHDKGSPKFVCLNGGKAISAKYFKFDFANRKVAPWETSPKEILLSSLKLSNDMAIDNVTAANSSESKFAYAPPPQSSMNDKAPATAEILDLTAKMSPDGTLDWTPESDNYIVLRIGYTSTGRQNAPATFRGLECDKLTKRGLDAHWPNYMDVFLDELGMKGVLKYATIDSYEVGGQNWTDNFAEEFKKRRGYDIKKWLPAVFGYTVESPSKSARFLYDLQRTVSDLFAENYYDYFSELCHKNGLLSIIEGYGGPFDEMRVSRTADIPASEFWLSGGTTGRHAFSVNNFYGKRTAAAESFTTGWGRDGYWRQFPRLLKASGDSMWAEGTNALIVHSYVHQPFVNARPGLALGPHGSHINVNTTWWNDGKAWVDYINRGQTLLQMGRTPSDVLILAGESSPNRRTRSTAYDWQLLDAGYFFDFCAADDLVDSLKIEGGKIVAPSGVKYSVFSMLEEKRPTLKTLKAIEKMLENGVTVCAQRPIGSPSLADNDAEYAALVERLWGKNETNTARKIGVGTLYPDLSAARAVADLKITPALKTPKKFKSILRSDGNTEVCFIVNPVKSQNSGTFEVRCAEGKTPRIFDAATGKIKPLAQWEYKNGAIKFDMDFAPEESVFVVLSDVKAPRHFKTFASELADNSKDNSPIEIIEARYRLRDTNSGGKDVTEIVGKQTNAPFKVTNKLLGDPYPNKFKELYLKYRVGKIEFETILGENATYYWQGAEWKTPPSITAEIIDGKPAAVFAATGKAEGTLSDGTKFSVAIDKLPKPLNLSKNWEVEFAKDLGAPEGKIKFKNLESWTARAESGIKYFSGTAKYTKTFNVPEGFLNADNRAILSLGEVREIARVKVNGIDAGILWKIPYSTDITKLLKSGDNSIEIDVTNLWYNRLVGDEINSPLKIGTTPKWVLEGKAKADDNSRYTYTLSKGWDKDSKPDESGLIGPVKILSAKIVTAK